MALGFPGAFPGGLTTGYLIVGACQFFVNVNGALGYPSFFPGSTGGGMTVGAVQQGVTNEIDGDTPLTIAVDGSPIFTVSGGFTATLAGDVPLAIAVDGTPAFNHNPSIAGDVTLALAVDGTPAFTPGTHTPHRYWRIWGGLTSGTYVGFAEIELRDSIGGTDRTGSGTASASASNAPNPPSLAVDNSTSTLWTSYTSGSPQWWAYDFGSGNAYDIVQIVITPRQDGFYQESPQIFSVEYSDNNSTWTCAAYGIYKWASAAAHTFNLGDYPPYSAPHDMTSASSHSPYVTSASSNQASDRSFAAFGITFASIGWASATGVTAAWLKIDTGSAVTYTSYGIQVGTLNMSFWQAARCPQDWTLEGSNNDSTWTTLHTATGQTAWAEGERRNFRITSPSSYRYYRLNISTNNGGTYVMVEQVFLDADTVAAHTIDGDVTVSIGIDGTPQLNRHPVLAGDIPLTISVDGSPAFSRQHVLAGDVPLTIGVDGLPQHNIHPELLGAVQLTIGVDGAPEASHPEYVIDGDIPLAIAVAGTPTIARSHVLDGDVPLRIYLDGGPLLYTPNLTLISVYAYGWGF